MHSLDNGHNSLAVDQIYDEDCSFMCWMHAWKYIGSFWKPAHYCIWSWASFSQLKPLWLYCCYFAFMKYHRSYYPFIYHYALGQQRNHPASKDLLKTTSHVNSDEIKIWHLLRIQCARPYVKYFVYMISFHLKCMRLSLSPLYTGGNKEMIRNGRDHTTSKEQRFIMHLFFL